MGAGHSRGSPYYWTLRREAEVVRDAREAKTTGEGGEEKKKHKIDNAIHLVPIQGYRDPSHENPSYENSVDPSFFEANGWTEEENQQQQLGGDFFEEHGWEERSQHQQIGENFFEDRGWEREESFANLVMRSLNIP